MASRALLRRKRLISDYLCASGRSVHCLSYLGHGEVPRCKVSDGNGNDREPLYTYTSSRVPRGIAVAGKVEPFIIVPFMEFLLPVFLKLFPNMLPSTFQDKMKEQEALKRRLQARIEYARFLQDTVKEMAKEVQNSRSGEINQTAEDLDEFLNRVRTGAQVSNEEILSFAKLFNDELTLDNISRPRLVNMCKYMGINPFGTDHYLRYMLRKRLQRIKEDDKLIQAEGIESLSEAELREDCRERGMLGILSMEEMRQQLRDWLDLSLNHSVPSSLLILSRSFTVSGKVKPEEAVGATLSSLPDEVVDTVGFNTLPSEDSVAERRRKLEYLAMQEELIKEEEEKEEEEHSRIKEAIGSEEDAALREMTSRTAEEALELARARMLEKNEELCEISRALAVLASVSSVSSEREEFLQLVNKEIELYNSMVDKEGTHDEKDAMRAYIAAREDNSTSSEVTEHKVSSALIDKVDAMLQNLEKEIDNVDDEIGDRWRILDRDYDGKVTPEEVTSSALYLKSTLGKEGVQELISNLSKDGGKPFFPMAPWRIGRASMTGLFNKVSVSPPISSNVATLRCFYSVDAHTQSLREKFMDQMSFLDINSQIGSCMPLAMMRIGTIIHNIEMRPGQGGKLVRAAGTCAKILKEPSASRFVSVRMPSGIEKLIDTRCKATIGQVSNPSHKSRKLRKAGQSRWLGRRPVVRGVAMNPVDHPHGGGEGRSKSSGKYGRTSVSPWGKPTKSGYKTGPLKRRK